MRADLNLLREVRPWLQPPATVPKFYLRCLWIIVQLVTAYWFSNQVSPFFTSSSRKTKMLIAKLRPYCQVVTWLGIVFLVVNVILTALSPTPVLSWLRETVTGTGFIEDTRGRVRQAEEEYEPAA